MPMMVFSGKLAISSFLLTTASLAWSFSIPNVRGRLLRDTDALFEAYDYVVIGGGTAGLTVADRLSEDGETTVLVIENGELSPSNSNETNWVRDRVEWMAELHWIYWLWSNPNKELNDKVTHVNIANLVGGGSHLNGMQTVRGTKADYNRWGAFFSNHSDWTWDGLLPYYRKALHFQPPSEEAAQQMPGLRYDESYWGQSSRVYAGWPEFQWPGIKYQFDAFLEIPGVEIPSDSGSGSPGVYWYPTYVDIEGTGNRSSSRTGHWDNIARENYHLLTETKVIRVELDGERALGVVARANTTHGGQGKETFVQAKKEVILAAGTAHSPQVLQLSGIGPRALLENAGIESRVDLPGVGQHFHDHTTLHSKITFQNYNIRPNRRDDFEDPTFRAWADELWEANRTGPWSRGLWNTAAWLSMPMVAPDAYATLAEQVDAQNAADFLPDESHPTVIAGYRARLASLAQAIRSKDDVFYAHYFSGDEPVDYFTFEHPVSVGTININVSSPESEPVVDYRTYSNPVDFEIMLELARFHRKINVQSPALAQFEPFEVSPGLNVTSREDWITYMRGNTEPTALHPAGTCAMMPLELGGVVDEELKVYGVEGLRVVDASVMSHEPGGNIAGAVWAIAEKAADMIKNGSQIL